MQPQKQNFWSNNKHIYDSDQIGFQSRYCPAVPLPAICEWLFPQEPSHGLLCRAKPLMMDCVPTHGKAASPQKWQLHPSSSVNDPLQGTLLRKRFCLWFQDFFLAFFPTLSGRMVRVELFATADFNFYVAESTNLLFYGYLILNVI